MPIACRLRTETPGSECNLCLSVDDPRNIQWIPKVRSGFTLIELSIVVLITAVGAAIVVPNWSRFQTEQRLAAAAMAVSADVRALQTYAVRHGQPLLLSVTADGTTLAVSPAVPRLLGDASGNIDYARRYPGIIFAFGQFDSNANARIDIEGQLVSPATNQRLDTAVVRLNRGGSTIDVDLLRSLSPSD